MKRLIAPLYLSAFSMAIFGMSACSDAGTKPVKAQVKPVINTPAPVAQKVQLTPEAMGRKIYARCRACHTLKEGGRHTVGPNLWQVFGRTAGQTEGYAYSKAMVASNVIWTEETLSSYLESPAKYIAKNKMAFAGLRKQADRDNLLAYLKANTE